MLVPIQISTTAGAFHRCLRVCRHTHSRTFTFRFIHADTSSSETDASNSKERTKSTAIATATSAMAATRQVKLAARCWQMTVPRMPTSFMRGRSAVGPAAGGRLQQVGGAQGLDRKPSPWQHAYACLREGCLKSEPFELSVKRHAVLMGYANLPGLLCFKSQTTILRVR